jgi:phenylpyruvate tautomerase PptA (4-oxalocrotonate tautomerase family)
MIYYTIKQLEKIMNIMKEKSKHIIRHVTDCRVKVLRESYYHIYY